MKTTIRFRNIEASDELRVAVERLAYLHLSRFGGEVRNVRIGVSDVNGPRGGVDKRCQVAVSGDRLGQVSVQQMHGDVAIAIELALDRAARAVGRSLERQREQRPRALSALATTT